MQAGIRGWFGIVWLGWASTAWAGGGPERTLVVVHEDSPLSLQVAHTYQRLRQIPDRHVVYLSGLPVYAYGGQASISLTECRETILVPILQYMDREDLIADIDTIVYSTGFPYVVNLQELVEQHDWQQSPAASLTACTYFAHELFAGSIDWLDLWSNKYFRGGIPKEGKSNRPKTEAEAALEKKAKDEYVNKKYAASIKTFQELFTTYRNDGNLWYNLACSQALVGLRSQALDSLEKAVANGWSDAFWARSDADLRILRMDERFKELLRTMKEREPVRFPSRGYAFTSIWSEKADPETVAVWDARDMKGGGYYLSTVLGHTGLRGNTAPEVLAMLERAAAADGTQPDGTVYLLQSGNIRSRAREQAFEFTAEELEARGTRVEVLSLETEGQDGQMPLGKPDVLGAVMGAETYRWSGSGSTMVAGALADNLTGLGAAFWSSKETKLSELIRAGAIGTSGTVAEPGAISAKFPTPLLFAYYADGCSMAESFYQATSGPYQLLVVGDALARPFARFVSVPFPELAEPWSDQVQIQAPPVSAEGPPIARYELWLDGTQVAEAPPGGELTLSTVGRDDGFHEVRLVAVEDSPIQTRSTVRRQVQFDNHGHWVKAQLGAARVSFGEAVQVEGQTSEGATEVRVRQGSRVLARAVPVDGRFQCSIDSPRLGPGASSFTVVADFPERQGARSDLLSVAIDPPPVQKADSRDYWSLPGVYVTASTPSGRGQEFGITSLEPSCNYPLWENWQDLGSEDLTSFTLQGEFRVDAPGFYELFLSTTKVSSVRVDGDTRMELVSPGAQTAFAGMSLEPGWHSLHVALQSNDLGFQFQLFLSGAEEGVFLGADRLRFVPSNLQAVDRAPDIQLLGAHAASALTDGSREGDSQIIPSGELTLTWKSYQRNVASVVIYPAPGDEGSAAWPANWSVQKRSGRNAWEDVEGLHVVSGWDPARGAREQTVPAYVQFNFSPTSVRELRIRSLDDATGGAVRLREVEVQERATIRRS